MQNNIESEASTTRQFTLRYILLITAIIAVCLVPLSWWGLWGLPASIWLVCAGVALLQKRYAVAGWLAALLALGCLLLPTIGTAGPAARRVACMNNLKQITRAIQLYELTHGHLPPPYTTDDEGNPLHSWRVLILPYLEEQELYDAIDLTKPWHHPNNLALQNRMPLGYRCASYEGGAIGDDVTTAYVAIIGEHTVWPRSGKRVSDDITDGTSKTLSVLESEEHRLHWMSTADPGIEAIGPLNAAGETLLSKTNHNGGVVFSYVDANVGFLASETDLADLISLLTIDGDDTLRNQP